MLLESCSALLCGTGVLAYAVRGRSSTLLAPSVYRGPRGSRDIALTFDDGPTRSTAEILRILERSGVRATFFQCGSAVRRNRAMAQAVLNAGHEIGNHTDSHPYFYFRTPRFIFEEIAGAQVAIAEATGVSPRYFRPPYGIRWFGMRSAQQKLGLMGVMWTVIGRDWRLDASAVAERVLRQVKNGAIICLHDGRAAAIDPDISNTIDAVQRIIPALLEKGYRFRTLTELLCPKN